VRLQILSDLHLETEDFAPEPAPGAELLVLAGDIDSRWAGFERFRAWPVPVLYVAGNHEFDEREFDDVWPALRERCNPLGFTMLERQSALLTDANGRRIRFVATIRWSDLDLLGTRDRDRVWRSAAYFMKIMRATRHGLPFDAGGVREEALACRAWLAAELARANDGWDATVVITHYGPSLRSCDPRFGDQPGTASFCNADDDLLPRADLWIHGHVHCRHDYRVARGDGTSMRVVCNARGHARKGEAENFDGKMVVEV